MEHLILLLEIANDTHKLLQIVEHLKSTQATELEQPQESGEMNFLKRIKRGIEFLGDWFSDKPDDKLITEYGFLRTFVEWD